MHGTHEHPLSRTMRRGFNCDVCRVGYRGGNPSYYCDGCDYDVCIKCFGAEPEVYRLEELVKSVRQVQWQQAHPNSRVRRTHCGWARARSR